MNLSRLSFLGLFLLFTGGFTACEKNATSTSNTNNAELKINYEKYTLDNGLDVILHKDDSDPIVSVAIMFHVGSNREKVGRTGFAHFFEHMLFQNSENVGKGNFFKIIDKMGGEFNGGTWNDGTVYYEVVPRDALEKILWMESDRMGFMINTVTDPVFQNEKQVVKNEKRQRIDNQPYGHTGYVIGKALYPPEHPYNWQVIGSLEDLDAATLNDVKEFYDTWYGPNNATMVIAGDIDFDQTKKWVEKYFGEIPAKAEVEAITPRAGSLPQSINLMHEDNFAQLPELTIVWPSVEDGHKDMYALNYLGQLLSQGKRAPLYKEVVEKQKLAPNVRAYNLEKELAGEFTIEVRGNAGTDLNQVLAAIDKGMADFEANGIDDRDMERIKNKLETDFYQGISGILYKSFQLAQMNEFRGSPDELAKEIKRILAVSKADVMRVYNTYIKGRPRLTTSFVPKGMAKLAIKGATKAEVVEEKIVAGAEPLPLPEDNTSFVKTPSKIDRTAEPALGAPPTITPPSIWEKTLSNELTVMGIQNMELPLVQFSLRLKGGLLLDDPNKIGVANLITDLMQEGTKNKTPEELEDAIGQLGADISMSTSSEFITISGNCLARNYDKTMELLEEILLEPRWDETEFDRIKKSTITQIQQNNGQPNRITARVFSKILYGDKILGNSTFGDIPTVEKITTDDLKNYYEQNFSPSISSFHVVGAVSENQVLASLSSIEEKWGKKAVEIPTVEGLVPVEEPKVYFVDIPEAKQSVIRIGMPAFKGNDADYSTARAVNERLGGGTSGRFFQQLREEKGYTYGAYSFFPRRINQSFFAATASVRSNVTYESAALFSEILKGYKEGYSQEDLDITKNALTKGNALAFETLHDKLGILQNITTFNLPEDYISQEEQALQNLTLNDAKILIDKYMNPDKMFYLVVGDAKTQMKGLKKLGFGNPILLNKDGSPANNLKN